ncbi:sensor histidine kinase [Gracilibacillus dipsosauri]|uniref:sensor histidine kinase n=1 Tax=Gracilibacillus dipsosauri TaxID=178340 RepID=UPI0024098189
MLKHIKKWNTLRNQLLVVYLFVILLVLIIVSAITYISVEDLLQNNAEEQIRQTAIESSGRYDSLYEQLNMVTKQVITNEEVQHTLFNETRGDTITFDQRQSLMNTVNLIQANADGIYSIEIYTKNYERVIPIDSTSLVDRVNKKWITAANEARGGLIWLGEDPYDENYFLVGRQINLVDRNFLRGGYILARISRSHFQLNPTKQEEGLKDYTVVLDEQNRPIVSNFNGDRNRLLHTDSDRLMIDDEEYMIVQHTSELTGWTTYMLTPVRHLTNGMSTVQAGIVVAGIIGIMIFLVSSYFLSTFITKPITRLTKTMREAGEGVLAQNPVIPSTNEINELNQTYNQLAAETNYLVQMVYEKELLKNRTELKALQAQIHPHFLFNTLDALYWSLDEKEEEELANVVLAMSELFRYTITKENEEEWVMIKDELAHIERYMEIMRMRFGDRLNWEKEVDFQWLDAKIPKLMIQPIVENAILHGAGNVVGPCHVTVNIEKTELENRLRISVIDNGPGMNQEMLAHVNSLMSGYHKNKRGSGLALYNVQKRLNLFFEEKEYQPIVIESEEKKGTRVSFEIPIRS